MTASTPQPRAVQHRRALGLAYVTVGWNVIEAVVAIGAGLLAGSVALVGFGVDSSIEIAAAVGLARRLRQAGPDAAAGEEGAAEKRALQVVAVTFFLLAAYLTYESAIALLARDEPTSSPVGLALAMLSLAIMPALAWAKQRTGRVMGSRAVIAEAKETWVCSYLSLALLAGVGLYALAGWWWADPVAALAMLPVIVWQGWETWGEARDSEAESP